MDGNNFEKVLTVLLLIGIFFFFKGTKPKKKKDIDQGNDPEDDEMSESVTDDNPDYRG